MLEYPGSFPTDWGKGKKASSHWAWATDERNPNERLGRLPVADYLSVPMHAALLASGCDPSRDDEQVPGRHGAEGGL